MSACANPKKPHSKSVKITSEEPLLAVCGNPLFWNMKYHETRRISEDLTSLLICNSVTQLNLFLITVLIALTYRCYTFGLKTCSYAAKGNPWECEDHRSWWLLWRTDLVLLEEGWGEDCVGKLKKYRGLRAWKKGFPFLEQMFTFLKAKERQGTVFSVAGVSFQPGPSAD